MSQFGTEFCDQFAIVRFEDGAWQAPALRPLEPLQLHPAAHVFHYASTCFEGFKAYPMAKHGFTASKITLRACKRAPRHCACLFPMQTCWRTWLSVWFGRILK